MSDTISLSDLIQKSSSILILLGKVSSKIDAYGIASLCQILSQVDKKVTIISTSKISSDVESIIKEYELEIKTEIPSNQYILSINYEEGGVEKVVYDIDKEKKKLVFKIFPSKKGFSFDSVEYDSRDCSFDAVISINIENYKKLGNMYEQNEYIFRELPLCEINTKKESLCTQLSKQILSLASKEALETLMKGMTDNLNLLEGYVDNDVWESISNMAKEGIDISDLIRTKYYSKPSGYLELVKILLENVKTNKRAKIIWSTVNIKEISQCSLNPLNLNLSGRLQFNVSNEFVLAFAFFEIEKNKVRVIIESNNPDEYEAQTIAGVFGGKGDQLRAEAILDMKMKDIDDRFWPIISDLYGLSIGKRNLQIVDNSPKALTKRRKNSKNVRLTTSR